MDDLTAKLSLGQAWPARDEKTAAAEATGGRDEAVNWVRVATTVGTPNAAIVAGRLQSHQIPTRVTQEAAGVHAIAVNVGIFGTAHVWVPQERQEQAQAILATNWSEEQEETP